MKRMTLLAKKEGLSTGDFRNYWAGPHAALALGMSGISNYAQNRVDKLLWTSQEVPRYDVDGIVELYFRDQEAMREAQASTVGQRHIPRDEPNFLKGWTLCVVETTGAETERPPGAAKVIVPFALGVSSQQALFRAMTEHARAANLRFELNWTTSTARRQQLWSEPSPPDGFAVLWFASVAQAHEAFDEGAICGLLAAHVATATAYLVDELVIC